MDPDPLRLLETAHPLRSPALLPSSPNSRFRLRPNDRLTHIPETVNKRVNKIVKNVDGPTQMSRYRFPGFHQKHPSLVFVRVREQRPALAQQGSKLENEDDDEDPRKPGAFLGAT